MVFIFGTTCILGGTFAALVQVWDFRSVSQCSRARQSELYRCDRPTDSCTGAVLVNGRARMTFS